MLDCSRVHTGLITLLKRMVHGPLGASRTPRPGQPTSATPETANFVPNATLLQSDPLLLALARVSRCEAARRTHWLRDRALLRLFYHGWCASHRSTKILRNMSQMATLLHQSASSSRHALAAPGDNAEKAEDAVAAATGLACLQVELQLCEGTCRNTLGGQAAQLRALEDQLAGARATLSREQQRNAAVLHQLAAELAATHMRARSALYSASALARKV